MMYRAQGFIVGFVLAAGLAYAAPITFASTAMPVSAVVDARFICYSHDSNGWHVQGPVCPRVDPAVLTGVTHSRSRNLSRRQSARLWHSRRDARA